MRWYVLASTTSAPSASRSALSRALTAPRVPTGMKAGSGTCPGRCATSPVRAAPSVAVDLDYAGHRRLRSGALRSRPGPPPWRRRRRGTGSPRPGRWRTAGATPVRRTPRPAAAGWTGADGSWSPARRPPGRGRRRGCRGRSARRAPRWRRPTRGPAPRWSRPPPPGRPAAQAAMVAGGHRVALGVDDVLLGGGGGDRPEGVEPDGQVDAGRRWPRPARHAARSSGVKCSPAVGAAADRSARPAVAA